MDDRALIERYLASRDSDAFATLIDRHHRYVSRIVAAILGPERSAFVEDTVQDVFVRCESTLGAFRNESAFTSWLYRLAYTIAIDARRSLLSRRAREDTFARERMRRRTEAGEDAAVRDAVQRLPDLYRFVVHAHYWLGHTTAEIAEMLDVPEGTVKSYLFRARARMARLLEGR